MTKFAFKIVKYEIEFKTCLNQKKNFTLNMKKT